MLRLLDLQKLNSWAQRYKGRPGWPCPFHCGSSDLQDRSPALVPSPLGHWDLERLPLPLGHQLPGSNPADSPHTPPPGPSLSLGRGAGALPGLRSALCLTAGPCPALGCPDHAGLSPPRPGGPRTPCRMWCHLSPETPHNMSAPVSEQKDTSLSHLQVLLSPRLHNNFWFSG